MWNSLLEDRTVVLLSEKSKKCRSSWGWRSLGSWTPTLWRWCRSPGAEFLMLGTSVPFLACQGGGKLTLPTGNRSQEVFTEHWDFINYYLRRKYHLPQMFSLIKDCGLYTGFAKGRCWFCHWESCESLGEGDSTYILQDLWRRGWHNDHFCS